MLSEAEVHEVEREIVEIVARSRLEGWYEDHPGWGRVDELLSQLGLPNGFRAANDT